MSRFMRERYQTMDAYVPGEQPRDMQYIKLNTNESPFPPAPAVTAALKASDVENLRLYSDPTCLKLRQKLGALYGLEAENVLVTNGSDDALNFAFMAFGEGGAVFPDITYGFYPVFAKLHGIEAEQIPLKEDLSIDYRDFFGKNKLTVIANPNAPTGLSLPKEQIVEILKANPQAVVVIDEAYVDFGGDSCADLVNRFDNLLVVQTFSKSRSLAGGRLGFALGCKELIADLEKLRYSTNPYNINSLTMKLGEATLDNNGYYMDNCRTIMENRDYTARQLEKLGFSVIPSKANFVFARSGRVSGKVLYEELKKRGVLVRHFSNPRISDYLRITVGTKAQMDGLLAAVKDILSGGAL